MSVPAVANTIAGGWSLAAPPADIARPVSPQLAETAPFRPSQILGTEATPGSETEPPSRALPMDATIPGDQMIPPEVLETAPSRAVPMDATIPVPSLPLDVTALSAHAPPQEVKTDPGIPPESLILERRASSPSPAPRPVEEPPTEREVEPAAPPKPSEAPPAAPVTLTVPPRSSGSRWGFSGVEPARSVPAPDPASSISGAGDMELELARARRRPWIHGALIAIIVFFTIGTAYYLYAGMDALRSPPAPKPAPAAAPAPGPPPTNTAPPVLVEVSGIGRIDRAAVSLSLQRDALPALRPCFTRPKGLLSIELTATGAVKAIALDGRGPDSKRQQDCVRTALDGWSAPVPQGGAVLLRLPLSAP
jgi:hypothetical protein